MNTQAQSNEQGNTGKTYRATFINSGGYHEKVSVKITAPNEASAIEQARAKIYFFSKGKFGQVENQGPLHAYRLKAVDEI